MDAGGSDFPVYPAGVSKSTNNGETWSATGGNVWSLAINPTTPATLYAGTYIGGIFKSTNGGTNWSPVNVGLANKTVNVVAIDPVTPSTIYAGTWRGGVFVLK